MEEFVEAVEQQDDGFVAYLRRDDGFVYTTDLCDTAKQAHDAADTWRHWYDNVGTGGAESIYYIVAVPDGWAGLPEGSHRYSGLRVKIGRARDVMRRLANLRTGTSSDFIVHALEPGSPALEAQRHQQFASDRRQGEWFACSPNLMKHIFHTWQRNNALPQGHQIEVVLLQHRIDALTDARRALGRQPYMGNPSIEESWAGKAVLLDLAYTGWREIDPAALFSFGTPSETTDDEGQSSPDV